MKLVDANVLLYAVNEASPRHREARAWLDASFSGNETVAFAWIALLAFLRLATHEALFPRPLASNDGIDVLRTWLARPTAVIVEPTHRHLDVVAELLSGVGPLGTSSTTSIWRRSHSSMAVSSCRTTPTSPVFGLDWQTPGD